MEFLGSDEFILKVCNVSDLEYTHRKSVEDYGFTLSISAWLPNEPFMVEQYITSFYPDLEDMGIEELSEGDMYYYGSLNRRQMVNRLSSLGFIVEEVIDRDVFSTGLDNDTIVELEAKLARAISLEDYENATIIRDKIKSLGK